MFNEWRSTIELRGSEINVAKTINLESNKENVLSPCGICGGGIDVNSVLCIACNKRCHHRCTGLASHSRVTDYMCVMCNGARQNIHAFDETIVTDAGTTE